MPGAIGIDERGFAAPDAKALLALFRSRGPGGVPPLSGAGQRVLGGVGRASGQPPLLLVLRAEVGRLPLLGAVEMDERGLAAADTEALLAAGFVQQLLRGHGLKSRGCPKGRNDSRQFRPVLRRAGQCSRPAGTMQLKIQESAVSGGSIPFQ